MSIFRGSRYEGVPYTTVIDESGKERRFIGLRDTVNKEKIRNNFTIQTVINDEEIDLIAYESDNSALKWWVIAEANDIDFPLDIEPGTMLVIPGNNVFANPEEFVGD